MDKEWLLTQLRTTAATQWERFIKLHPEMRRTTLPSIELNGRCTSTAGRCFALENRIEMSYKLFLFPENVKDLFSVTLPHELAHQVDFNINGWPKGNRWHGPTWKGIMVRYGLPPDTYHSLRTK